MSSFSADQPLAWLTSVQNEKETQLLAKDFASVLTPGFVIGLVGSLGAGKTRFVRYLCESLGVDLEHVTSPTFTLIQEYQGSIPIYHLDTYRLEHQAELLELGIEELIDSAGVCFIEWADKFEELLPQDSLWIQIELTGLESRQFSFSAQGPKTSILLNSLIQKIENR